MKRHKPSERMPTEHGKKVIICTELGWCEVFYDLDNNLFATYAENGDDVIFRPSEVLWWGDPMEVEE